MENISDRFEEMDANGKNITEAIPILERILKRYSFSQDDDDRFVAYILDYFKVF